MERFFAAGYPYEIVGLCYYAFFLWMGRPRVAAVYARRSRLLTLLAAIALVGSVPLHYGGSPLGLAAMFILALAATVSTVLDGAFRGSGRGR